MTRSFDTKQVISESFFPVSLLTSPE